MLILTPTPLVPYVSHVDLCCMNSFWRLSVVCRNKADILCNALTAFFMMMMYMKCRKVWNFQVSSSSLSDCMSCPVNTGGCGAQWAGTYGGCAEKLYVADNIFHQWFPSPWRLEGLKSSNTPSGILQVATNPIYLYLWPVSNLSVELTSPTERVRSAVTRQTFQTTQIAWHRGREQIPEISRRFSSILHNCYVPGK